MADYLALERARIFRRLLVTRFGVLAVMIIAGVGLFSLSAFALFGVGLCMVAPVWAWIVERRCERRLVHRLDKVPVPTTHVVEPAAPTRAPSGRKS